MLDIFLMFFGLQQPIFDILAHFGVFGCGSGLLSVVDTAFCKYLFYFILTYLREKIFLNFLNNFKK